jgi:hypothetical protein
VDGRLRPFGYPVRPPTLAGKLAEYVRLGFQLGRYWQVLLRPLGAVNSAQARGLALPFGRWVRRHRLSYFHQAAYPLLRSFGFGFEDQAIPAAYIFKALPQFARGGNLLSLWNVASVALSHVEEGYGELWRRLADGLAVRLGVEIQRLERSDAGGLVHTADGPVPFDQLILACSLDRTLAFLDAAPEERELFSKIRSFPVWQAVVAAEGLPPALILDRYQAFTTIGHPMILLRYRPDASWYYLFGYAGPAQTDDDIQQMIDAALRDLRARLHGPPRFTRWSGYFPHYAPHEFAAGYHARLERLQGRRATHYVGEIMANIGVESVASYSERLMQQAFA